MRSREKAEFYHHLGVMLDGGLGVLQATHELAVHPPSASIETRCTQLEKTVRERGVLSEAMTLDREGFEPFEAAAIFAGENAGRVAEVCSALSLYWEKTDRLQSAMRSGLLYPLAIVELATVAGAIAAGSRDGSIGVALAAHMSVVNLALAFAWALVTGARSGPWLAGLLRGVPGVGTLFSAPELVRTVLALRLQLEAGVPLLSAVPAALQAGGPHHERWTATVCDAIRRGDSLTEAFAPLLEAHPNLASSVATGEASGRMTETLAFLQRRLEADWEHRAKLWAEWLPKLVYFGAVVYAASQIFRALSGLGSLYEM